MASGDGGDEAPAGGASWAIPSVKSIQVQIAFVSPCHDDRPLGTCLPHPATVLVRISRLSVQPLSDAEVEDRLRDGRPDVTGA